jgi:FAD/FMN-containing dehydrogenase
VVPIHEIERFAASSGITLRWPLDYLHAPREWQREKVLEEQTALFDVTTNPCVDFGRYQELIPRCVFSPRTETQLQAVLRFLRSIALPYKLRGSGHSSGGQTLIRDGAVVDLRKLSFIDVESDDLVTVGGGAWWLELVEHLLPDRRPAVLTDNLRATIGGTLAVGGFGDTSHVFGLQIDSVERLELVTPDGALHRLSRGDDLFGLVLAGRGQLGAIASATLRTIHRPAVLVARLLVWDRLEDYLADAPSLTAFEYLRARRFWSPARIEAIAGSFGEPNDAALRPIERARISAAWETIDLAATQRSEAPTWSDATPAVEITLPVSSALATLADIDEILASNDLLRHLASGASISIIPPSKLPLAPLASHEPSLLLALRPQMRPSEARAKLPALRSIGTLTLTRAGKLYTMSVEPQPLDLRAQYGPALENLRTTKELLDPSAILNPGLL